MSVSHTDTYIPFLKKRECYSWRIITGDWLPRLRLIRYIMNLYLRLCFFHPRPLCLPHGCLWVVTAEADNTRLHSCQLLTRPQSKGVTAFEHLTFMMSSFRLVITHYVCMSQLIQAVTSFLILTSATVFFLLKWSVQSWKKGAGFFFYTHLQFLKWSVRIWW